MTKKLAGTFFAYLFSKKGTLFAYLFSKQRTLSRSYPGFNGQDWVAGPLTESLASRKDYHDFKTHHDSLPGTVGQDPLPLRNMFRNVK